MIDPVDAAITAAVAARGTAHPRDLGPFEDLSDSGVRHRMLRLAAAGALVPLGRGAYAPRESPLTGTPRTVHDLLTRTRLAAHLSGFHVIAPFAHQTPLGGVPVLVFVDPDDAAQLELELARAGMLAIPHDQVERVQSPERRRELVLLARQSADVQRRLGVAGWLASPEKAWVDLLRAIVDDGYPLSPLDAGRMLGGGCAAGVIRTPGVLRVLRHYRPLWREFAAVVGDDEPQRPTPRATAVRAGIGAER